MVDAQIDMLCIFLNVVALPEELDAGHPPPQRQGRKLRSKHRDGHVAWYMAEDRVAAQLTAAFLPYCSGQGKSAVPEPIVSPSGFFVARIRMSSRSAKPRSRDHKFWS